LVVRKQQPKLQQYHKVEKRKGERGEKRGESLAGQVSLAGKGAGNKVGQGQGYEKSTFGHEAWVRTLEIADWVTRMQTLFHFLLLPYFSVANRVKSR
jgi:hypothetical protein